MLEKRYHYSEKGQAIAEDTGLHDALGELETDATQELTNPLGFMGIDPVQELTVETVASAYFQELSDLEQREVLRAINRFAADEADALSWLVEGERSDDNLLGLPETESKERATREDLITLIGASALDFYEAEQKSWLENWREHGFKGKLDAAIFATAAAMDNMERYMEEPGGSFSYRIGHNTCRNIWLGATLHGDFRMEQYDTHPHGATTPAGRKVDFAPNGEEVSIGSYHSSEPLIATRALEHLYRTHGSKEEIRSLLEAVNEQIKADDSRAERGNFGDYGDGGTRIIVDMLERSKKQWREGDLASDKDGTVLEQLMVHPGSHSARLEIVSFSEYLHFVQTNYTVEGEHDSQCIDIPNDHVADFLAALYRQTKSGAGRTAPGAIETLLQTAALR